MDNKKENYDKLSREFGFIDEYKNGYGYLKNTEQMKRLYARAEAWRDMGIGLNSGISNYTLTPSIAKNMGDKLLLLPLIGKTTARKIQSLPSNADEIFNTKYEQWYNSELIQYMVNERCENQAEHVHTWKQPKETGSIVYQT